MIHFVSSSLICVMERMRSAGSTYSAPATNTPTTASRRQMSHQQDWKTRSAVSWSSRAIAMVISLPATDPKPTFEKLR